MLCCIKLKLSLLPAEEQGFCWKTETRSGKCVT